MTFTDILDEYRVPYKRHGEHLLTSNPLLTTSNVSSRIESNTKKMMPFTAPIHSGHSIGNRTKNFRLFFRQFTHAIPLPLVVASMICTIFHVFLPRSPFDVTKPVIPRNTINMPAFHSFWTRANKSGENYNMKVVSFLPAHANHDMTGLHMTCSGQPMPRSFESTPKRSIGTDAIFGAIKTFKRSI